MRRPRPLQRLIDGSPEDSGRAIARRAALLMVPAVVGAHTIGAAVVYVLAAFVVPGPPVEEDEDVLLANLVAAGVYVLAASVVGTIWGIRAFRPVLDWLRAEREPSESERRMILRSPLRLLVVSASLWACAVVAFVALNLVWSAALAFKVGLTVALGGVTTSAAAYLVGERIGRPVAARALASGVPDRPVMPGVTTRALLAWALGSAVPAVGLLLVGIASLAGRDINEHDLAITALGLGGLVLAAGLLVTWQAAQAIRAPVVAVRDALRRVEAGDYDEEVPVFDGSELGLLQAGFNQMEAGLRERERMRDVFGRQVGEDVAHAALERGIELGGEELDVAVLFVDLVGSTRMAAERSPSEVVDLLNHFFGVVVDAVERRDGMVNKFVGDATLAIFGAPNLRDDAAACALAAARELARRLPEEAAGLDAGIGVSAGRVVAGNVGAERRFEYTVIGDPVNEASRLCELAKSYDSRVLASERAVKAAGEDEAEHWRLGDEVELRGRPEPTRLAEPVG
ncbi:MAG: HAMP domain-containing protein [Actinomycetota bacterium]|nr:HAMP domain-containing protein [Actinomycetota bacterium]